MSVADETGGRAERIRAKAQEMKEAAERVSDPQERRRLEDKARRPPGAERSGFHEGRRRHEPALTGRRPPVVGSGRPGPRRPGRFTVPGEASRLPARRAYCVNRGSHFTW